MADGVTVGFDPRILREVENYALLGATNEQIANFLRIKPAAFAELVERYPELSDALERGGILAAARVAEALYHTAIGFTRPAVKVGFHQGAPVFASYDHFYPPNARAQEFFLTNRAPHLWKKMQTITVNPAAKDELDLSVLTEEELRIIEARAIGHDKKDSG